MKKYYYAQAFASDGQAIQAIHEAAKALGVAAEDVFIDKADRVGPVQKALDELLDTVLIGDTVYVPSLQALGVTMGNTADHVRLIEDTGAKLVVTDMPATAVAEQERQATPLSELLEYIVTSDRAMRHRLQSQGYDEARQRGVKFGSRCKPKPRTYNKYLDMYRKGEITGDELSRRMGVSRSTVYRWIKADGAGKREAKRKGQA